MTIKRLGFACKWIDHPHQVNGIKAKDDAKIYNTGGTTVAWLNRQTREVAEQKLWDLMVQNINSVKSLIGRVSTLDPSLRMVRISSDILPVYTEKSWRYFWQRSDVRDYCEKHFQEAGDIATQHNVRISFHPGQFCVLASENPDVVERSIEEFEYHADMARWLGRGQRFQDMKINVHISGRLGPEGIRKVYPKLSVEARNCITIENEEISYGLDDCLTISDIVPIVLDIHHHHIHSLDYIEPDDPRIQRVIDSWRGVRPTMHYSASREDLLLDHCPYTRPDLPSLLKQGHKKMKLRAHSDFMWNHALNDWALAHNEWADIMVEAKGKNLASFALFEYRQSLDKYLKIA